MKKILILLITFTALKAYAQVDRSVAPEPGPAPEIKLGNYEEFTLNNGLKVFVVENHKLPTVQFSLILAHEAVQEGDKAGYVDLSGQLMRHGTKTRAKAQLDKEVDFIGASLSSSSSGVYASSLTKHVDKLLELMTDVLYNPTFPQEELDKLKKQTLSGLAANKEDANAIAGNVSRVLTYGKDHPYGELTTEETIENISMEDVKSYYNKYFVPGNAYLAIVGDLSTQDAKQLANKYFASWKGANVPSQNFHTPKQPEKTFVALVDRPNAVQSIVNVSYPVDLKPGAANLEAARVMNQILGGGFSSRLMQNLREDKAFTYGARSSLSYDQLIGRFNASASVRNEVTDSAVHEFISELSKIRTNQVEDKELAAAKAYITGSFARSLESPSTIASFAVNMAKYNLPKDYYQNYLKRIAVVSKSDVMAAAQQYILPHKAYITIVGKSDEIGDKLKPFGEVRMYDIYGNIEKAAADVSDLPPANQVINNYVKAIGGEEQLNKVENIIINSEAEIQGMKINISNVSANPGKSINSISMNGMTIQQVVYNQGKAKMMAQGQNIPVNEKMLEEMKYNTSIFPELTYEKIGVSTEVKGIKNVNGEEAYMIQVKYPTGTTKTDYYSTHSGLKLKTEGLPTGSIEYKDYKEVDGIKFPHTMNLSTPQGPMTAKVSEIKINTDIPAERFKVE